jgi:hypothetical protein
VVVVCHTDSAETLAQTILETIWETYGIFNILLLIADSKHHMTGNGNYILKDVKSDIYSLSLFTLYPFDIDNKVSLIDNWVQEDEGRFLRHVDLFPPKIPKNFNGLRLNVSTILF